MKTLLPLLAFLGLTACGCAADMTMTFDAPEAALLPTEGPADLLEALDDASQAWLDAGVTPAHVADVAYLPLESLDEACGYPTGQALLGCSLGPSLLFVEGLFDHRQAREAVVHELGHSTRNANGGGGGHLPCDSFPGNDIMCFGGSVDEVITYRDIAFVLNEVESDLDIERRKAGL